MNKRNIIIILIVVLALIIAGYFFFSKKAVAPVTPLPGQSTTTPPSSPVSPPESDEHSALNECTTLKQAEAKDKGKFLTGTLLVGFQKGTKLNDAVKIMNEYKLSLVPTETDVAEKNLADYGWLAVEVPRGEEFKFQCILEADPRLRSARLNFILEFHE